MRARITITFVLLAAAASSSAAAQAFSVIVSGNSVIVTTGTGLTGGQCCRGAAIDDPFGTSGFCSQPCGAPVTQTFACNWVGTHVVYACWSDATTNGYVCDSQPVTVTTPPGLSCNTGTSLRFDIGNNTPSTHTRVLLSNMSRDISGAPNYLYPHYQQFFARDRTILVGLRVIVAGVATSGIPVTLRVIDPPDPAPYVAGGSGVVLPVPGSEAGDNVGTTLPTLAGTGVTPNGDGTYAVLSGENGYIGLEMELAADAVAGDNYRVVATATLPDGSTRTETSGPITAWKRMFFEKRPMFRRGSVLATDAPIGATSIVIPLGAIASTGVNAFARNDFIMLMHAPAWGQAKTAAGFYSGVYRIAARPQRFRAHDAVAGPGAVTTDGTAQIVGTGTRFGRLDIGDVLNIGPDSRIVVAVADNTHVTVHAPTTTATADQPYTIGDPNLLSGAYYRRIELDRPLAETYAREPLASPGVVTLNDAVVRLNGGTLTATDYFDVNSDVLTGSTVPPWNRPFAAAYTEYVALAHEASGSGPSGARPVPRMVLSAGKRAQQFIDKWFTLPTPQPAQSTPTDRLDLFSYPLPPNHQLLLVGDTDNAQVTQSGALGFFFRAIDGEQVAILNRGTIEQRVTVSDSPIYQADAETVAQRTATHEMVHQWMVNVPEFGTNRTDHCHPQVAYDSVVPYPAASGTPPSGLQFCLMSWTDASPQMPAPWNPSQMINMVQYFYRNGWTSCHVTPSGPSWHSEYTGIRQTPDPWTP